MQGAVCRPKEGRIAIKAGPAFVISALRFPPALPSRLHTDSGLHSCHKFSSGICSATAFGGFYLGGKCSAQLVKRFINGVHSSPLQRGENTSIPQPRKQPMKPCPGCPNPKACAKAGRCMKPKAKPAGKSGKKGY